MFRITLISFLLFTSAVSFGQAADSALFDFWVGSWEASWENPDGSMGKGINKIVKIIDNKVIQENFLDSAPGGLKGTSISVYNPQTKVWHQAWADNQGGYFDLEGGIDGDKRFFKTRMKEKDGKKIFQRMIFYNIKSNSFTWDWQSTTDGGKSWSLQWRITYKRIPD